MATWTPALITGTLLSLAALAGVACAVPPEPEPDLPKGLSPADVPARAAADPEPTETAESATMSRSHSETGSVDYGSQPEASADQIAVLASGVYVAFHGAATASIEERIFLSDIVVRADLITVADGALGFRAVEYLKGAGADEFLVRAATKGRDPQWDGQEAVLFLSLPESGSQTGSSTGASAEFEFADTTEFDYGSPTGGGATSYTGDLPEGYTIDSRNPVWLPLQQGSGPGTDGATDGDSAFITASDSVSGDAFPTISLADLRSKTAWVEGGAGIEGYDYCIRASLDDLRYDRDWEAYHGRPYLPVHYEAQISSGSGRGKIVHLYSGTLGDPSYDRVWVAGPDASQFSTQIVDDDDDPTNGYASSLTTARPLPAGTYRVMSHRQSHWYEPCGFRTQFHGLEWTVTMTSPLGTLHEALFDPADLYPGVGFSPTAGALTGDAFSVGGKTTSIAGLRWEQGAIVLALDPFVPLDGRTLHLIAPDGTIGLALSASSAVPDMSAGTLTWAAADRPWEVGDQLMLRIWSPPETPSPVSVHDLKTLSAGGGHTCSLRADGVAICWGDDNDGQASPPGGERFVAMAAGGDHACGLRPDGEPVCWGSDDDGQASPPGGERFVAIAAGGDHTCGLRPDGEPVCWGSDGDGQASPPGGERFVAIAAGGDHTCGLRPDGEPVCWGSDGDGRSSPPAGERFAAIGTGDRHTCGLRPDGEVWCWGARDTGRPGSAVGKLVAISVGMDHTCGLRPDGTAVCWGRDRDGQASPPEDERFASISAGGDHTCGLRPDGTAVCWGSVEHGAARLWTRHWRLASIDAGGEHTCGLAADGAAVCWGRDSPYGDASPPDDRFAAVSAGRYYTCGLRPDGRAVCWGDDEYGQSDPPEDERFIDLSAGGAHSCGLRPDGTAACWGSDLYGQSSPPEDERFIDLSAGDDHTCGLRADGIAVCWGDDHYGQSSPPEDERFIAIDAGLAFTCGLRADGRAACWDTEIQPPEEIFIAISAAWGHACGLRADGVAVCWGSDHYGEASPPEDERFIAVAASWEHSCGLRTDGMAVCWGYDGDGRATPPSVESAPLGLGRHYTCEAGTDGSVWCRFDDTVQPSGELGGTAIGDDHGNSVGTASHAPVGEPVPGLIEYAGDLDLFAFDAQEGEIYLIEAYPGTLADAWVELNDSKGRPLALGGGGVASLASRVAFRAPATGLLFVGLGGYGTDTGTYTLTVLKAGDDHGNSDVDASHARIGEPVPGMIEHGEDVDVFVFYGSEDEIYQIDVALGTLSESRVALFDDALGRRVVHSGDPGGSRTFWELSETGTLYVEVSGAGQRTGSYTLTVSGYEDDHGDSAEDASRVPVGEPVAGDLEYLEHVEYHCDRDFFSFDARRGEIYRIDVALGTLAGAWIDLYDSDRWLAWNKVSEDDEGESRTFWRARDSGELFVEIRGCGRWARHPRVPRAFPHSDLIDMGTEGTYTLTVSTADVEDDHANDVANASPILVGESAPGRLEYEGDEDLFSFDVLEGVLYQFEVVPGTLRGTWTSLHDGSGWEWEGYWDPLHPGPDIPGSSDSSRIWRAGQTGRAVVSVGGFYVSDTGTYTLTVTESEIEDDHADGTGGASHAPFGVSVPGSIQFKNDTDLFAFDAIEGETYQIDAVRGTLFGLTIELRGAGGSVDLIDDDVLDYRNYLETSRIVWRAPHTARMFVAVTGTRLWALGTYTLTISRHEDDHGDDAASATQVTLGEPVSGSIHEEGDLDFFSFDPRGGETYLIDSAEGTIYDLYVEVLDGDGNRVALNFTEYPGFSSNPDPRIAWRAPDSARVFVRVRGEGSDTGTYSLTISDQEDDHGNNRVHASRVSIGKTIPGSIEYEYDEDLFAFDAREGRGLPD